MNSMSQRIEYKYSDSLNAIKTGIILKLLLYGPLKTAKQLYFFCERERLLIFERKVWSEIKNGEGEWGSLGPLGLMPMS